MKFSSYFLRLSLTLTLGLFLITSLPQPLYSQPLSISQWSKRYLEGVKKILGIAPKPRPAPRVQKLPPGQRQALGKRAGDTCLPTKEPLTALIPATDFGLTVAENPTLFFYVPQTSALVEFELLDEKDNELYKKTFKVTDTPGVVSVNLPANKTSSLLEVGKNYHWYLSVICNPEDRTQDLTLEGWMQRGELDPAFISELEQAKPRERPAYYAAAGAWYDALAALAQLRRSNPNDATIATEWSALLQSVELGEVAQEPLVHCCLVEK